MPALSRWRLVNMGGLGNGNSRLALVFQFQISSLDASQMFHEIGRSQLRHRRMREALYFS